MPERVIFDILRNDSMQPNQESKLQSGAMPMGNAQWAMPNV